jgi:hypothetical protein
MPLDLKDEVATTLIYDGVPLTLSRGATPGTVTVRVDSSNVPWVDHGPDAPRTAKLEMLRVTFDKKDKRLQQGATVFEASAPAVKSGMAAQKVTIDLPLTFDADLRAVRLRVVVRALDSGKIGTANLDIAAK